MGQKLGSNKNNSFIFVFYHYFYINTSKQFKKIKKINLKLIWVDFEYWVDFFIYFYFF